MQGSRSAKPKGEVAMLALRPLLERFGLKPGKTVKDLRKRQPLRDGHRSKCLDDREIIREMLWAAKHTKVTEERGSDRLLIAPTSLRFTPSIGLAARCASNALH